MESKKHLLNFENLSDELLDTPIYRVFSLGKFLTSINENNLYFIKAKSLEDPFEAFLLKQLIWADDGSENYPFEIGVRENFYIQCWTFLSESNFLWKIYSPHSDGVMIKSTLRKMINLFFEEQRDWGSFYLGKIKYKKEADIIKEYESRDTVKKLFSNQWFETILNSLLVKREEFKQEEEVRIIYYANDGGSEYIPLVKNGFTKERLELFNELSDELILDPRIDPIFAESIMKLAKSHGFKKPMRQSTLFNLPYLKLRIDKNEARELIYPV